jgi:hypothetical protein
MLIGITFLELLIALTINIMPEDVARIEVTVPDEDQPMYFCPQRDGGWYRTDVKQPPKLEFLYYVDGTEVTVKRLPGKQTFDLLEELGLDEGTDLDGITEFETRGSKVTIKKLETGVDYHVRTRGDVKEEEVVIKMRWKKKGE